MKIKTSELSGSNLDWAVAVSVGAHCQETGGADLHTGKTWVVSGFRAMRWDDWTPSTDWSQGGPLIERFDITIMRIDGFAQSEPLYQVMQSFHGLHLGGDRVMPVAPTRLIAACRAIVAAKLGDEVYVPEGLV